MDKLYSAFDREKAQAAIAAVLFGRVKIGNTWYRISRSLNDPVLRSVVNKKKYEKEVSLAIRTALGIQHGALIDVGANTGQTLIKALEYSTDLPYVGFEPQISCITSLNNFIKLNSLLNHLILPVGLSDHSGAARLGFRKSFDVTASIIASYRPAGFHTEYQYVPVLSGDAVLMDLNLPNISLIKIDVEGAELEVLNGLKQTINKYRPSIIFEILPNILVSTKQPIGEEAQNYRARKHSAMEVFFRDTGYTVFNINKGSPLTEEAHLFAKGQTASNYLAIPSNSQLDSSAFFS
jgi:FkbM family methyltransferase